jgi:hypothetical protein
MSLSFLRLKQPTRDEVDGFVRGQQTLEHGLLDFGNQEAITMTGALIVAETKGTLAGVDEVVLHQYDGKRVRGWVVHGITPFLDRLPSQCDNARRELGGRLQVTSSQPLNERVANTHSASPLEFVLRERSTRTTLLKSGHIRRYPYNISLRFSYFVSNAVLHGSWHRERRTSRFQVLAFRDGHNDERGLKPHSFSRLCLYGEIQDMQDD